MLVDKTRAWFVLLCIVFVLFSGCEVLVKDETEPIEITQPMRLYMCPNDDCFSALGEELQSAVTSIHCAWFDVDLLDYLTLLETKSRYVEVKLVVDDTNKKGLENFSFIRFDSSSQYSHNKFCIIDNHAVTTGSMNPTFNGVNKNRNNLLILYSDALSENYEEEFSELWSGEFGKGELVRHPVVWYNGIKIENYFCPEDSCSKRLEALIESANSSIHFMTFSFTDMRIANDLIIADDRGVEIHGVFEKQQKSQYSQLDRLANQGLDVQWDNLSAKMHHKVFVIDESITLLGSYNPTKSGDERNDENIIIVHSQDMASIFIDEYYNIIVS